MKKKMLPVRLLFAGLLLSVNANMVLGQTGTAGDSATSSPQLKVSPMKALQNFEPAENEEYALGPGDEISLDFPGRPELGGKKVVGPDGRITLSLVGPLNVADKNRNEVAKLVVDALAPYYKDLTVTVNIDKYGSNRIVIIGSVQHPGVLYFDNTPTLLDVIARGATGRLPCAMESRSAARSTVATTRSCGSI
jgi:polysaccharide export outer membrane protein